MTVKEWDRPRDHRIGQGDAYYEGLVCILSLMCKRIHNSRSPIQANITTQEHTWDLTDKQTSGQAPTEKSCVHSGS